MRVGGFGSGSSLSEVLDGGVQGLVENQLRRAGGAVRSEVEDQKMQQKTPKDKEVMDFDLSLLSATLRLNTNRKHKN